MCRPSPESAPCGISAPPDYPVSVSALAYARQMDFETLVFGAVVGQAVSCVVKTRAESGRLG